MSLSRATTNSPEVPRATWESDGSVLTVVFASGSAYHFQGVPKRFYTELLAKKDPKKYVRDHLMARFEFIREVA